MTNDTSDFRPLLRKGGSFGEANRTADINDGCAELHYTLYSCGGGWSLTVRRDGGNVSEAEATLDGISDDYAVAVKLFDLLCRGAAHPEHCRDIIEDLLS